MTRNRGDIELMVAQIEAIDAWHAAHRAQAEPPVVMTRELRLDLSRRVEARRQEHNALLARTAQALAGSGDVLGTSGRLRALLAHRNSWLREAVGQRLELHGVVVVGSFDDGAEAAGTLVAEQPDLVLVEDRLPTLSGLDVLRRARRFAPQAIVGVQVADNTTAEQALQGGADAVFSRRVPPQDIAACLLERLRSPERAAVGSVSQARVGV